MVGRDKAIKGVSMWPVMEINKEQSQEGRECGGSRRKNTYWKGVWTERGRGAGWGLPDDPSCAPVDGVVWLSISQWMYSWSGQLAGGMQLEQILPRTGLMAVSYYAWGIYESYIISLLLEYCKAKKK